MSKRTLKNIAKNLKKSSKVHANQAKQIDSMLKMKKKPSKNTLDSMVRPFDMSKGSKDAKKLNKIFEPKKKKEVKIGNTTYTVSDKKLSALKKKTSPALAKLSASCKAAAKRKFKVYPSAYANMWAAKTQRQGKC